MNDPDFDKPPAPRRPLISDESVRWLCATATGLGLLVFGHHHPDIARGVLAGLAILVGFVVFAIMANS
jgi:hypothetical protein